jgi:hypothetical protein
MSGATPFELEIHQRLLRQDRAASGELMEAYVEQVYRRVRRRYPGVSDETLVYDAVVDAMMNYVRRPAQYDPDRLMLLGYLTMAAAGDLKNALERLQRRPRLVPIDDVEHRALAWNLEQVQDETSMIESLSARTDPRRQEMLQQLNALFPSARDRELLALVLDRVRETEPYARILEITGWEKQRQRDEVKKHKDRIKVALRRLGVRLRDEP